MARSLEMTEREKREGRGLHEDESEITVTKPEAKHRQGLCAGARGWGRGRKDSPHQPWEGTGPHPHSDFQLLHPEL